VCVAAGGIGERLVSSIQHLLPSFTTSTFKIAEHEYNARAEDLIDASWDSQEPRLGSRRLSRRYKRGLAGGQSSSKG